MRRHRGFPSKYKSNKGKHRFSAPSKLGGAGRSKMASLGFRCPDLPQAVLPPKVKLRTACGTHRHDAPPKIQNLDKWKRNVYLFRAAGGPVAPLPRTSAREMWNYATQL